MNIFKKIYDKISYKAMYEKLLKEKKIELEKYKAMSYDELLINYADVKSKVERKKLSIIMD